MAELITWCRLMRVGPACAKPCDDCRITSRKYAVAGIDPAATIAAFYDAPEPRRKPLTHEPSGFVLTRRGLDYLANRKQQHPKDPHQ